jgi:hypothetical protein
VCINGLSVNILPTQMIALWNTDFLQYAEDNVTPDNQIQIAIRRSGTGAGFPLNPDGTTQLNIVFLCPIDLGTQLVELWARDKAGNIHFCDTYVIVQDNVGICGNPNSNVGICIKTACTNEPMDEFTVTTTDGIRSAGTAHPIRRSADDRTSARRRRGTGGIRDGPRRERSLERDSDRAKHADGWRG